MNELPFCVVGLECPLNITNPTAAQSDEREHEWREDEGLSEVRVEPVVRHEG